MISSSLYARKLRIIIRECKGMSCSQAALSNLVRLLCYALENNHSGKVLTEFMK